MIGLASLAASIWAGALAVRALRWQQADLTATAPRLATAVRAAEQEARGAGARLAWRRLPRSVLP